MKRKIGYVLLGMILNVFLGGSVEAGSAPLVRPALPALYVLSVGLNRAKCLEFLYPEKDALDIAQALQNFDHLLGKSSNYAYVKVNLLRGRQATTANVKDALERLKNSAQAGDTVLVYLGGLAFPKSGATSYTFATYQEPVPQSQCDPNAPSPGIALEDFRETFRTLKDARVVLLADTLSQDFVDALELPRGSLALGIDPAIEDKNARNGLLTSGLLEALRTYQTSTSHQFSLMDLVAGAQNKLMNQAQLVVNFRGTSWDLFSDFSQDK
jgi:hypothetical protein